VIAPLLSQFALRHPQLEVQLQLTDSPINLVEQAYDLGIRFGDLPDTRLSARKIMSNRRFLCASPAYLQAHGTPQSRRAGPAPLHRAPAERRRLRHLALEPWPRHAHGEGARHVASNDGDVVLGWALDGHGILLRSEWDLARYLDSGRLRGAGRLRPGAGRPVRLLPQPPSTARQSARFYQFSRPAPAAGRGHGSESG
jgi:DNA-binding transcriptional LysR family regulator